MENQVYSFTKGTVDGCSGGLFFRLSDLKKNPQQKRIETPQLGQLGLHERLAKDGSFAGCSKTFAHDTHGNMRTSPPKLTYMSSKK